MDLGPGRTAEAAWNAGFSRHRGRTSPDAIVQDSPAVAVTARASDAGAIAATRRVVLIATVRGPSRQDRPSTSTVTMSTSWYFWCRTELA